MGLTVEPRACRVTFPEAGDHSLQPLPPSALSHCRVSQSCQNMVSCPHGTHPPRANCAYAQSQETAHFSQPARGGGSSQQLHVLLPLASVAPRGKAACMAAFDAGYFPRETPCAMGLQAQAHGVYSGIAWAGGRVVDNQNMGDRVTGAALWVPKEAGRGDVRRRGSLKRHIRRMTKSYVRILFCSEAFHRRRVRRCETFQLLLAGLPGPGAGSMNTIRSGGMTGRRTQHGHRDARVGRWVKLISGSHRDSLTPAIDPPTDPLAGARLTMRAQQDGAAVLDQTS
jgi:hypothetical protein